MCLLDYEFDGDYELMLVASGRGRLAADCFEDEEQPGEALEPSGRSMTVFPGIFPWSWRTTGLGATASRRWILPFWKS